MLLASLKKIVCTLVAIAIPVAAWSAPPSKTKNESPAKTVDLFAGMESGEIEVAMFMKDSTEGTMTVANKTDKPLTIKIPEAFAGVPVLAQRRGGGGGGGMGGGMGGGGGGMQGMGGGMMGGMGGRGGGMGGGMGGMMNIGPDKVQKVKLAAVCLDHGKTDPNPRVPYQPVPINSYAKDPAIAELIKLMCHAQLDQHSAQAAAWHLQNGLTWEEMAQKIGAKHIDGRQEPYFTADQLNRALAATTIAKHLAEKSAKENLESTSPGQALSQASP
jgi:hypothetical protein